MNVIITGSRNFTDFDKMVKVCDTLLHGSRDVTILSGGAKGADRLGERYARYKMLPYEIIKPEWDRYGRQARYIRNFDLATKGDVLIMFWDGKSRGSGHMLNLAREKELVVHEEVFEPIEI